MSAVYEPRLGEPLGPESLTWRLMGDYRWLLFGMRAGLLQTLHPAVNKALRDHDSTYFQGPMKRILRSLPQILGVVFDDNAAVTGATVRDYHKPLKGTLTDGSRYHALNPDVFYWPHATFFEQQIAAMDHFGKPLSASKKERLYQESIQWFSLYGVSMQSVPSDYTQFVEYWDHTVDTTLEPNGLLRGLVRTSKGVFGPSPFSYLPEPLWRPISDGQFDAMAWVTRGTLPPQVREMGDLAWSDADERKLRTIGSAVAQTFGRLPRQLRLQPAARAAFKRSAREVPLVHGLN